MKWFSPRLFALGLALGAISAAAVLAASAYASSNQTADQVIVWNRVLLGILRTPGAQPPTVHPTRSLAILHAAIYDAVVAIDHSAPPYVVRLHAPRTASRPAAVDAAAHATLVALYPGMS